MQPGSAPPMRPEIGEALARLIEWESATVDFSGLSQPDSWRALRAQAPMLRPPWARDPFVDFTIRDVEIVGGEATPLRLVVYSHKTGVQRGVIYFVHGGGMVEGSVRSPDVHQLLNLASELGLAVIEVDYALAPEHPFPAGVEDAYAGLCWVAANFEAETVVLAGVSGGANVALGAALIARDRSGPVAAGAIIASPMVDDRCDSVSHHQWERAGLEEMWEAYLSGDRGGEGVSPIAAPARATNLAGLPPMLIDVGTADRLRDEAVALASQVWADGGRADLHVWDGGAHGFESWAADTPLARELISVRRVWLERILDESSLPNDPPAIQQQPKDGGR